MVEITNGFPSPLILEADQLDSLIETLSDDGRQVIGPVVHDDAVVYRPVSRAADLPQFIHDTQEPGTYRLKKVDDPRYFASVVGPQTWKHYLFPPKQTLWKAERKGKGFAVAKDTTDDAPSYAFLGVRACELAALAIHDKVFDNGDFADPEYLARRKKTLIVAVNCTRAGGNCFCTSMDTGPRASTGYDLALTELVDGKTHRLLVEIGSEQGAAIMAGLDTLPASQCDLDDAAVAVQSASDNMGRQMTTGAKKALRRNPDHPQWDDIAARCLSCANCTMVCPTCFCSTTKDLTSLDGQGAERQRVWDSCFTMDFSYIHGGNIRRESRSRYRQWITHKLSYWHEQFGVSGCTGCGRCITWCPVGIDITEEARIIATKPGKGDT